MSNTNSTGGLQSIVPIAIAVLRDELGSTHARAAAQPLVPAGAPPDAAAADVALLHGAHPVEPGDAVYLSHAIPRGRLSATCLVHATDLIGPSGHRIPATHVRAEVRLASTSALAPDNLHVEIRVPTDASGGYTGYLQADDLSVRVLLTITVGRPVA